MLAAGDMADRVDLKLRRANTIPKCHMMPRILSTLVRMLKGREPTIAPRLPASGWVEVERMGLHWRLNLESCISQSIVQFAVWEPSTTHLLTDLVRSGMHVLDIGANFGYYTLLLARQVGPTGHVWAFEPVKRFRDQLEWHVNRNGFDGRVSIVPYGLSDRSSTMTITGDASSATLHLTTPTPADRTDDIALHALDDVAADLGIRRLDFIKIDIDGHEPCFLRGAQRTLSRFHPPMALEFAQHCLHVAGSDVREQARLLRDLGYAICREDTRQPYDSEMAFLMACGNFDRSGNALAMCSVEGRPSVTQTERT
jgi:FkbM family methyltransferase